MATYLGLYPKPYVLSPKNSAVPEAKYFHIDPGMTTEEVEKKVTEAAWDEQIVLRIVLTDLPFPVPMGFRKADWSAWVVHPLPDHEVDVTLDEATSNG